MENCIFCKIVSNELDSVKIWENENFIAILDVMPNVEGMTLIIPKKHYDSYIFDINNDIYSNFMLATKKVAKLLEKGLDVKRVAMVMEGMGVNHAHTKLYPLYGLSNNFEEMWAQEKVYFDKYEGYLTTKNGPKKSIEELNEVANKIRNAY